MGSLSPKRFGVRAAGPHGHSSDIGDGGSLGPTTAGLLLPKLNLRGTVPTGERFVIPGWFNRLSTSVPCPANTIVYIPILVPRTTTYDRILIDVIGSVAGTARLGIYNDLNGLPDTRVLDAGTVDTGTTGAKLITIAETLAADLLFGGQRHDNFIQPRFTIIVPEVCH